MSEPDLTLELIRVQGIRTAIKTDLLSGLAGRHTRVTTLQTQTREENECALTVFALTQGVVEPPGKRDRRPVSRRDASSALNSKVYQGKSARRPIAWLNHAVRRLSE